MQHQWAIQVKFTLLMLTVCVHAFEYYTEKPEFLKNATCKIYQPGFSECSKNSVQKLLDQLSIGIPEIVRDLGTYDPMKVKDIFFKQDNNEVATIRANLTNVVVKGFSKTRVLSSKVSKKDFSWITKIALPVMHMDANYQMDGRILLIPLRGSGKMWIEIENMRTTLYTKTRLYDQGGFTFDNVTEVRAAVNMSRVRTHFDNLFNGNSKELEALTNQFFNENWREFYTALKPIVIETVENVLYDIMHKVFKLIPANFFVEDIPKASEFYANKTNEG